MGMLIIACLSRLIIIIFCQKRRISQTVSHVAPAAGYNNKPEINADKAGLKYSMSTIGIFQFVLAKESKIKKAYSESYHIVTHLGLSGIFERHTTDASNVCCKDCQKPCPPDLNALKRHS